MGWAKSLPEIAKREGVDNSYVCGRMVNLSTPAPDIDDAVLHNALPDHLPLLHLAVDPPALWDVAKVADSFLGSKNASASLT